MSILVHDVLPSIEIATGASDLARGASIVHRSKAIDSQPTGKPCIRHSARDRHLVFKRVNILLLAVRQIGILEGVQHVVEDLVLDGEVRIHVVNQIQIQHHLLGVLFLLERAVATVVHLREAGTARIEYETHRQLACVLTTRSTDSRRGLPTQRIGVRALHALAGSTVQIIEHRFGNTRDRRPLTERNVLAARVCGPAEPLLQRSIVPGDRAHHRRILIAL